jgi:hypothetical protein
VDCPANHPICEFDLKTFSVSAQLNAATGTVKLKMDYSYETFDYPHGTCNVVSSSKIPPKETTLSLRAVDGLPCSYDWLDGDHVVAEHVSTIDSDPGSVAVPVMSCVDTSALSYGGFDTFPFALALAP